MSRHQYDLVQCMKQPGARTGLVCANCDGRCPICDSFVKPTTKVRICHDCSLGHLHNKCILCAATLDEDATAAYYCLECVRQEKDREGCPRIINIGSSKSQMIINKKKSGAKLERNPSRYSAWSWPNDSAFWRSNWRLEFSASAWKRFWYICSLANSAYLSMSMPPMATSSSCSTLSVSYRSISCVNISVWLDRVSNGTTASTDGCKAFAGGTCRLIMDSTCRRSSSDMGVSAVVSALEPVDGVFLVGLVRVADGGSASLSSGDSGTSSAHDNVEVHTVDTDTRVVLDTQVDVLVDTEPEVTGLREVSLSQLVFLDLQSSLQDLFSLGASDGDVDSDLFVSSDTEGSDGVSGLGANWGLTRQAFQNLGGSGQSVTGLTNTNVQH